MSTVSKIRSSKRIKALLVLVTFVLIVMMFPRGESLEFDVNVNTIWIKDDLIASMPFEILKDPILFEREKTAAANKVYPIFVRDDEAFEKTLDSIRAYHAYLIEVIDNELYLEESSPGKTFLTNNSYETLKNMRRQENILSSASNYKTGDIIKAAEDIFERIFRRGLLSQDYEYILRDSISIREGKFQRIFPKLNYYDPVSVMNLIDVRISRFFSGSESIKNAVREYLSYFVRPNLIYDEKLTAEAKQIEISKVSRNKGIVNENERIVAKHDRVTQEIKDKIDSYRIAKGFDTGFWSRFAQNLGKFLHIALIFLPLIIYIYLFRKKIYENNFNILIIMIVILFVSFIAYIISELEVSGPVDLLILVPVASMILTIIFDSRVGFYVTVVCALVVGGLRGNDYVISIMNIVAGGLAAYTVRDIKNRNQIFRSFLFILLGYVVSIIAFGLERFDPIEKILISSAYAASNSIISPALTFGLIIFFEKIFKITTELTLLELSDFNSPLLRELARNAPGTFTHSMTIGSMVESAAESIGANPILARVGAYYHDIGKLIKPEGFVENQMDNINLHENLEPEKSVQVIIEHVTKGIELGREYKLPQEVIDFIPMHHGTFIISYFYEAAKQKYGPENVSDKDYRYPGPKPNTKETALLMLADSCESAVRAMTEPDQKKVENVIHNLFKARIEDGQLDKAPITFKDIEKIKAEFLKVLLGQHHKRIRYPKQNELEDTPSTK